MPRILLAFLMLLVLLLPPPAIASEIGIPAAMQQAVESQLLALLGMSKRPRPRGPRSLRPTDIPPYMLELYHRINEEHQKDPDDHEQMEPSPFADVPIRGARAANTVRSFMHIDKGEHVSWKWSPHQTYLHFDIEGIPSVEKLAAAELRVYLNSNSSESGSRLKRRQRRQRMHVLVYEVIRAGSSFGEEPILRLLDSRQAKEGRWESLDVIPAVQRWMSEPKANKGLLLEVTTSKGDPHPEAHRLRFRRSLQPKDQRPKDQRPKDHKPKNQRPKDQRSKEQRQHHKHHQRWQDPLLVAYTDDGKARGRRHRAAERGQRIKGRQQTCQRQRLYVDFKDVGWQDWIVAPPGYHAYLCHGECPYSLPEHLNTTNHAVVQNLVNSMNPSLVPKACCVPTELSSISMLYMDEVDKVVLKNYNDMVVEACGCR